MTVRNTKSVTTDENIDVLNFPEGHSLLVELTSGDSYDGTVDFQTTPDGVTFYNVPYINRASVTPVPTIAQLSSISTATLYLVLGPLGQVRIACSGRTTDTLTVVYRSIPGGGITGLSQSSPIGIAETTTPSAVADGIAIKAHFDEYGRQAVFLAQDGTTNVLNSGDPSTDGVGGSGFAELSVRALGLYGLAPDGSFDRLRTVDDSAPGLGALAVGSRSPGASEVTAKLKDTATDSSARATVLTPTSGKKVRIIGAMAQNKSTTAAAVEVYFDTGASMAADDTKSIAQFYLDADTVPFAGLTYPDGGGPIGAADDVVSVRTDTDITNNVRVVVLYREE